MTRCQVQGRNFHKFDDISEPVYYINPKLNLYWNVRQSNQPWADWDINSF